MITTSQIVPAPALTSYVTCYTYRTFDTQGTNLTKAWHATHEISMPFFFKDLPDKLVDRNTGKILKASNADACCGIVGLSTQYNGDMIMNGSYSFFEIIFKPYGFHRIFGIPTTEIIDQITSGVDVFNTGIKLFYEQLCNVNGLVEMGSLANAFLLHYLNKQKAVHDKDRISEAVHFIIKSAGSISVDKLACHLNLTTRTFERQFAAALGMSPKLFTCITRFNYALDIKLKHPEMNWTSICHQAGYFDQMHLIKDFKRFSGDTPKIFIDHAPMIHEKFKGRVDTY